MRIALAYILPLTLLLSSCNSGEIERLQAEKLELIERTDDKNESINELLGELNDISDGLRQITEREDLLLGMTIDDVELAKSAEEMIEDDLFLIDNLIEENKEKITALELKVRKGNGKMQEFERLVANLKMDLLDRENSITILKGEIAELEGDYAELLSDYYDQALMSRLQDRELHKGYFAFGTKDEMVDMEVVEKVGGVLGLGATHKLKDGFNKDYFTEVDIRELESIPIESKSVDIVSTHPAESFELVEENERVRAIKIIDADKFWSSSKYLAMVVK